jgi:hypothetical protein
VIDSDLIEPSSCQKKSVKIFLLFLSLSLSPFSLSLSLSLSLSSAAETTAFKDLSFYLHH